ncbi:GDSL-type esterase/lipase family protein [Pontibacter sp. E15-1]|uniref:SGNH/GDSL hydrolase family protein n=1 Tax=Pontibacter sp. E15-1 TaxID=2919918 RepID=UPI001F4F8318|nr:SGNH/GDSL hydrolase family protein [Pontibacter sp. E15-1]MCJ8164171.1 GDSL-type esterase/lipase family protein [Pontibacter sp. E15-1]
MKLRYNSLVAVWCLCCISCTSLQRTSTQPDTLSATALLPFGRTTITPDHNLELISSAVHFGYSFEGTESQVYASIPNPEGHNYLQYKLDGVYQGRVKVSGGTAAPLTIKAPTAGKHEVWVYKATEAHTGPVIIEKVTGNKLQPLRNTAAPTIEFIGNSITCGAAADPSEVPCGTGVYHDQHNAYMAYGPRVARTLGAGYVLSSVSGIGMYRNWNSDGPTMPEVYEKANLQKNSSKLWNFNTFTPQIVSIALGTNDFSNGDGKRERLPFDSASFIQQYTGFVQLVKSKYPKAQIALLSSPMVQGTNARILQNALTAVKTSIDAAYPADAPVALYFFEPMQARGCSGHPNVEDHGIMARQLEPFFRELLQK